MTDSHHPPAPDQTVDASPHDGTTDATRSHRRPVVTPTPPPRRPPTRGRDGVTTAERETALAADPRTNRLEAEARSASAEQLPLFAPAPHGQYSPMLGGMVPLASDSPLPVARSWYRRELEQARRPANTIESYCYDLQIFEHIIGPRPLTGITRADIARFLGEAETRSTRKRRLTSLRRFFRFLIEDARVLKLDPSDGFFPHLITLRDPLPLFIDEQEALLAAADADEPWSGLAIFIMLRLGLTRGELLGLRRDHIDVSDPEQPVVFVAFDSTAKRGRERRLAAGQELTVRLNHYLAERKPADLLFPIGPPAVNGMVDRVRKSAGLTKAVTPQTLRHTFAVERARVGADAGKLLDLLGLVDDPRNRSSVDRYLRLATPPLG